MITDAWLAVTRRWRSTAFSVAAVAIGLLAVVATLGIAQSAAQHVVMTLRALSGTNAEVRISGSSWESDSGLSARLVQVSGVQAGGTLTVLPTDATEGLVVRTSRADVTGSVRLAVASEGGLLARGVGVVEGVIPSPTSLRHDTDTVVLGRAAAKRLLAVPEPGRDRVMLGSRTLAVTGIVTEKDTTSALDNAVIINPATARQLGLLPSQQTVFVRHDGSLDEAGLALAADPTSPEDVTVEMSASPASLQAQISGDTTTLVAVLTAVTITASGIGVANTMITSVWQRRGEIGISRAVGASRRRVGLTFLLEAGMIGLAGGLAGTILGVLLGAAVARAQDWAFALPPLALSAPAVGLVVGMAFGLFPAVKAASVDPAELLRSP